MSMTREEAIYTIERLAHTEAKWPGTEDTLEALDMALTALRPVSRERVEKVFPGCGMCSGWNTVKLKPCANGDLGVQADIGSVGKGDAFGLVVYNKHLASGYVDFPFCPFCGKPQTDEAVDILLRRLPANKKSSAN